MRKFSKITTLLSVSVSLGLLAGCGSQPAGTPQAKLPGALEQPALIGGPLAAQEGVDYDEDDTTTDDDMDEDEDTDTDEDTDEDEDNASPAPTASDDGGDGTGSVGGSGSGSGTLGNSRVGPGIGGGLSSGGRNTAGRFQFGARDLVAFQSDRATGGGGGSDVFVYDARAQTVLALPAVNTEGEEVNPRLSANGQWLVYQSDQMGSDDIFMFNMRNQLINSLRTLNTEAADETQPDVSDDGDMVVYVSNETGVDNLRVYDIENGNNYIVPVANRGLDDINWPTISGNGDVIAYGATSGGDEGSDVFVYSLRDAAQLTPPFINTGSGEYNPDLSENGEHVVFISDRRGSEDIYTVDLRSGFTDNMVLANSDATEQEPRFLGGDEDRVVFHSDRTGEFRIFAYDMESALLDTLPVAHEVGSDSLLREPDPGL